MRKIFLILIITAVSSMAFADSPWDQRVPVQLVAQKRRGCVSLNPFEEDAVEFSQSGKLVKKISNTAVVLEFQSIADARRVAGKSDVCVSMDNAIYLVDEDALPGNLGPVNLAARPIPGARCGIFSPELDALSVARGGVLLEAGRMIIIQFNNLTDARNAMGKRGKCSEIERDPFIY